MNDLSDRRGDTLRSGASSFGLGSTRLADLWSGGAERVLDRIDARLARGKIEATLPDGSHRVLGGRAKGFAVKVDLASYRALLRLATGGSVGWYQAWEAGEWSSPDPVSLFALFMDNAVELSDAARARGPWRLAVKALHALNRNSRKGARRNILAHYDLGNDFYGTWLGESMVYSSALFGAHSKRPNRASQFLSNLDRAQMVKNAAIGDRLQLRPGQSVLEIGCGWGTLAAYLANALGVDVTAISLSDEQLAYARRRWQPENGSVDFLRQDYREVRGQYDAIASVEMVEAVGREYWPAWFDCLERCLKPGGRAAIQFIAMREELFDDYARSADFIQSYIFPGGMLARTKDFRRLAAERGLEWRDPRWFGGSYARTLKIWRNSFEKAHAEGKLPEGFDQKFVDLWRYYLMYCEGGFRGKGIDVAQVTLVKAG